MLYKKRGHGMFVAPGACERLLDQRRERYFDAVIGPAVAEARRIGIPLRVVAAYVTRQDDDDVAT